MSDYTRLSKFISLVLRHKPEQIGLTLDKHGWAKVDDLLSRLNANQNQIDMEILEEIVRTDSKQRYSFNEDKTLIRANQGHSINVDLQLEECKPPNILYHGTATKYLDSIMEGGILSKSRQHVHLSKDIETAVNVGSRHGKVVVLKVNSEEMHKDGCKFFLSSNGVWLTDKVDKKYITVLEDR